MPIGERKSEQAAVEGVEIGRAQAQGLHPGAEGSKIGQPIEVGGEAPELGQVEDTRGAVGRLLQADRDQQRGPRLPGGSSGRIARPQKEVPRSIVGSVIGAKPLGWGREEGRDADAVEFRYRTRELMDVLQRGNAPEGEGQSVGHGGCGSSLEKGSEQQGGKHSASMQRCES